MTDAVHEAVLYRSASELAALLAPRLRPAIEAGGPVLAVLDPANGVALRAVLGTAADAVEFPDPERVHRVPAFTVAVRWARLSRRATQVGGRAAVVSQHVEGLPGIGPGHWARLDLAVDVATEGLPITVLCPYPENGDHLDLVHTTHRWLVTPAGVRHGTGYRPPRDAVVHYPPPPPPELGPPAADLDFVGADLPRLRRAVADCAESVGIDAERTSDLVLAVNEIASNSVEHGPGAGRLRMWTQASALITEVADSGRMDVAFPGLCAPPPRGDRGRGLWLASELSDVLQVWSADGGTIVRISTDI